MTTFKHGAAVLFGIAALVIVVQQERLRGAERRLVSASLVRDSLVAVHDTTRLIESGAVPAVVGDDSVRVWQRRAVQATQRADALDRGLAQERVARSNVQISTTGVDTTVALPTAGEGQVLRQPPYTVSLQALPTNPMDSVPRLAVRVQSDTLRLGVRVGCGAGSTVGVRAASVSVTAPTWTTVALDHVEQEPAVCNPAAFATERLGAIRRLIGRIGITAGYSAVVIGGTVVLRPTLGICLKLWP